MPKARSVANQKSIYLYRQRAKVQKDYVHRFLRF